jgi:hypothetical protein
MANIFNADNGVVSGSAGIKLSSDTTGVLNIQTNGTTAISVSSSQVVSFPATSGISFAGQITFAAGTAAAPSISVTGDTNTGIYFPGADQVAISTGGTQRVLVDASGVTTLAVNPVLTSGTANGMLYLNGSKQVASGTAFSVDVSSAAYPYFTVYGSQQSAINLNSDGGSVQTFNSYGTYAIQYSGFTPSTTSNLLYFAGNGIAYSSSKLQLFDSKVTIDGTGNVGIGTSSPSYRFQAVRSGDGITAGIAGGTYGIRFDNGGAFSSSMSTIHGVDSTLTGSYQPIMLNGSSVRFGISATEIARFSSTGLGITEGNNPTQALSLYRSGSTNAIMSAGNSNTGLDGTWFGVDAAGNGIVNVRGAFPLIFSTSANERARIDSSGNLLVGGTSALGKVTVQVAGTTTPTTGANVGPSSINLYAAGNGGSTDCTTGIFGWNANTGIASGIGFSRENSSDWGTQIRFYTHPTSTTNIGDITERVRITSTGNVGIGTTSPGSKLSVNGNAELLAGGTLVFQNPVNTGSGTILCPGGGSLSLRSYGAEMIGLSENATLIFSTNSAERARITSAGNFGIGTTSPAQPLHVDASGGGVVRVTRLGTSATAYGQLENDGTNSSISSTGALILNTGSSPAERARITSGGAWVVGDTSAYAVAIALAKSTAAGTSVYNSWNSATSGTRFHFEFRDGAGATSRGNITTDGANTAYNTSSDRRLKENIVPAAEAGTVIDAIEVVEFDWKSGSHTRFGMIAQDLNVVAPEAVTAGDDGEEIEKSWSVDYSKLVPMLVKEIQSLRQRVAQLEVK